MSSISVGGRKFLLSLIIVTASVFLVLGLMLPIVKLSQFYVLSDQHSLFSIVCALHQDNEIFLAVIIVLFSIVIPVLKIVYLLAAATIPEDDTIGREKILKRMEWLGKWSMLDVLILALMIFYIKSSGIADASSQPGIYFFFGAVLLTMLAHGWVKGPDVSKNRDAQAGPDGQADPDGQAAPEATPPSPAPPASQPAAAGSSRSPSIASSAASSAVATAVTKAPVRSSTPQETPSG